MGLIFLISNNPVMRDQSSAQRFPSLNKHHGANRVQGTAHHRRISSFIQVWCPLGRTAGLMDPSVRSGALSTFQPPCSLQLRCITHIHSSTAIIPYYLPSGGRIIHPLYQMKEKYRRTAHTKHARMHVQYTHPRRSITVRLTLCHITTQLTSRLFVSITGEGG